jgi:hypothetical protein
LGAQGGSLDGDGRENFAGGCADLPTLSEGLEIEHSDFEPEDAKLKGVILWQVLEIMIGGIPTIIEVYMLGMFRSLGRILLQGSVSTNLCDPMRHRVDLQEVEDAI